MAYRQHQNYGASTDNVPLGPADNAPYTDGGYSAANYNNAPGGGYSAPGNDYGYVPKKKGRSKWLLIGLPLAVLVIVGAVVGGVLGSRAAKDNDNASTSSSNAGSNGGSTSNGNLSTATDAGSAAASSAAVKGLARVATGTDTYLNPIYPTQTTGTAYGAPTASARANHQWPSDPDSPSSSSLRAHPRLIAPAYKWKALPQLIADDAYLASWNATIFANATKDAAADSITYELDGGLSGSGVLDPARILKMRIKNWGYAWRMSKDTKWVDRAYAELQVAMGDDASIPFGDPATGRWNPAHFLDVAEFTSAFGIAYDWFHDGFDDNQKAKLRDAIVTNGLNYCQAALTGASSASSYSWWTGVNGNWNCVCNAGCTLAALAIVDEDTTGVAQSVIDGATANAKGNCIRAVASDGTWVEGPNYWYFGTTGFAELSSALTVATGSDQGLLDANPDFYKTGMYHMYVTGMTSLFNYADHGPNKYSSTANSVMYLGGAAKHPEYTLFQRDRIDASEPFAMFWYDPSLIGSWWDGLALDHHFDSGSNDWASMRSTWTNNDGVYVAMKAGNMTSHQTHGDIDAGDFVLDALGQRWAGELGSGNYLSTGYFGGEDENAQRWLYYRKRTEGQNTIVLNKLNQAVQSQPPVFFGSSNDAQGASPVMSLASGSTAFYRMDLTDAYNGTKIERGVRMINQRQQVLIQDEITAPDASNIQWRMHTNATIAISDDKLTATLTLGGETMEVKILAPTTGAGFSTAPPIRYDSDPPLPTQTDDNVADQENKGTTVLVIEFTAGTTTSLEVLFNPKWPSNPTLVTPPNVALANWSVSSHN